MEKPNLDSGNVADPGNRGLSRPIKVVLLVLALLAGFFEHSLGTFTGPITMSAAALVVPVLLYRRYWHNIWFWITALLLGAIQVPLVALVRPYIEQERSFYMLALLMGDGLFVIVVVALVAQFQSDGLG